MTSPADTEDETGPRTPASISEPAADPRAGRVTPDIPLLQALSDAAREMHRSLSLGDVIRVATDRARQIIGAEEATTSLTDGDGFRGLTATSGTGARSRPGAASFDAAPDAEVRRTNRPLRLASVAASAEGPARRRSDATPPWLGAPLVGPDGRNLGVIQLVGKVDHSEFTAGDEAVILQLARMASVAIENARLYQAAIDTRSQLAWAAHVERVRAAELRAVINAMGEAVLVCDSSGQVNFVNAAADALFEGRPVKTYDDLLSRFELEESEPVDPVAGALELALREGPDRWIELRVYPVPEVARRPGDGDDSGGRIAVMREITAARQVRAQREAFLGILSHELRTPITTIYAGSKVLARDEPPDPRVSHELAIDISAEAERLFRLVEDLLVMTRIERGVLQLAHEPVLLQRVVDAAIRLETAHWPATPIHLTGPVDLPAVQGEATYVEQVVRNLLSNAAKYSPPGAEIEVRLASSDAAVSCRVLDHGRGFRSDETEDLFDLFYRSPATAAQAAGAGIGLFVCRRLVDGMGGRIWARPREGGGAEFGFELRRYRDDA